MHSQSELSVCLFTAEEISSAVDRVSAAMNRDYRDREAVLVVVLKGGFVFAADLLRRLQFDVRVEFLHAASYGESTVAGNLEWKAVGQWDLQGKHAILVDDILDTGHTAQRMIELLKSKSPASIATCFCFDKKARREVNIAVDYAALHTPDEFLVGYGMDYNERFRHLPYVAAYKEKS